MPLQRGEKSRHGSAPSWPSGLPIATRNHATRSSFPDQLEPRTSSIDVGEYISPTERSSTNPSPHAALLQRTPPKGHTPGRFDHGSPDFVPTWGMNGDHSPHVVFSMFETSNGRLLETLCLLNEPLVRIILRTLLLPHSSKPRNISPQRNTLPTRVIMVLLVVN